MRHKKVSERMINANRNNSRKSTGPRTSDGKRRSSRNALVHGLLSKNLVFQNSDDEDHFNELLKGFRRGYRPTDPVEAIYLREIAICTWKLGKAQSWEVETVECRQRVTTSVLKAMMAENDKNFENNLAFLEENGLAENGAGWEVSEMRFGTSSGSNASKGNPGHDTETNTGRLMVEGRLGSPLDTVLRYESMIRRDLYRAIDRFQRARKARKDRHRKNRPSSRA